MLRTFEQAQLLDEHGKVVVEGRVSLWSKTLPRGLVDWGGDLRPLSGTLQIAPGSYRLRLDRGRDVQIIVNNVRLSSVVGGNTLSIATFLGTGDPPIWD